MRPLLALALLLAGCSKEPAPKPLGNSTRTTGPIATINGEAVPCYTESGGLACGPWIPKAAKQDLMPVITVDEARGSIKCEAGEQSVEQFEYDIKPKTKGASGNELRDCLNDPACKQRITSHMRDISNAPDRIKALERRVAELEKRPELYSPLWTMGPVWVDPNISSNVHVASKERPIAKFHYEGGAWCNVWADAEGIHWEACK